MKNLAKSSSRRSTFLFFYVFYTLGIYLKKTEYFVSNLSNFCYFVICLVLSGGGGFKNMQHFAKPSFTSSICFPFFTFLTFFLDIYLEKSEYFVSNLFNLSHFEIYLCYPGGGGIKKYAESSQIELQMVHCFTFFTFFTFFPGHISEKKIVRLKSIESEPFCDLFGAIRGRGGEVKNMQNLAKLSST